MLTNEWDYYIKIFNISIKSIKLLSSLNLNRLVDLKIFFSTVFHSRLRFEQKTDAHRWWDYDQQTYDYVLSLFSQ